MLRVSKLGLFHEAWPPHAKRDSLTIESLGHEDIIELAAVAKTTNIETYQANESEEVLALMFGETFIEAIKNDLKNKRIQYSVCKDGNKVVGFAKLILRDEDAFLDKLYLLKDYHGMGQGTALLKRCYQIAVENGLNRLQLNVYRQNAKAIQFYSKHGLIHTSQFADYINPATKIVYTNSSMVMACDDIKEQLNNQKVSLH